MSKGEFKHESVEDRESIVKYLNALRDSFVSGTIHFGAQDKSIVLEPSKVIEMSVKAKRKSDRSRLSLSLEWKDEVQPKLEQSSLLITSKESKAP